MSQYRDGVFSAASPAPRYGTLTTTFENGSLGELLEDNAAALLNDALTRLRSALAAGGARRAYSAPQALAVLCADALAEQALAATNTSDKLALTIAASYSASQFGLPPNTLLTTVGQVCDSFAMTGNQRAALHQQALNVWKSAMLSLKKGNAMSGVFRDGVLGSAFQDGVLGAAGRMSAAVVRAPALRPTIATPAYARQQRAVRDGSLGDLRSLLSPRSRTLVTAPPSSSLFARAKKARRLSGLGCGCAGIGDDAAIVTEPTPFYKKPLVIGGAAVALGIAIYALNRK